MCLITEYVTPLTLVLFLAVSSFICYCCFCCSLQSMLYPYNSCNCFPNVEEFLTLPCRRRYPVNWCIDIDVKDSYGMIFDKFETMIFNKYLPQYSSVFLLPQIIAQINHTAVT